MAEADTLERPDQFHHPEEGDPSCLERVQQFGWDMGRLAVSPFVHSGLSTEDGYRPQRHAVLQPDSFVVAETRMGDFPMYVFNEDALGDRSDATDIYLHMSLGVRADQGFISPMADALHNIAEEQERGLVLIGAPASHGGFMTPREFSNFGLHRIVEGTHNAIDRLAENERVDLERGVHTGASLGGYVSLTFADQGIGLAREVAQKPEHETTMSIPIAPAGWKLRRHQVLRTAYQFLVLEGSHIVDKASLMEPDERDEYLLALRETVPQVAALPGIGKLAMQFLRDGDLEQRIGNLPPSLPIRAVAFDGDHVTLPHVLEKHLEYGRLTDAQVNIMDGRHMSLASLRKVMREVVRPALDEELDLVA